MTSDFVITGGGTGGHVFPALALADEMRRRDAGVRVLFVGTERGLETRLVPERGWRLALVRAKGLVGKSLAARLAGGAALPLAFLDSWRILSKERPRAVVGVGGYASGPVVATAALRRIPTVIHESNAVPGVTNRILARVASRVAVGTPAGLARLPHAVVTGNPVRAEFFAAGPLAGRAVPRRLRLLVVGGSQGAQVLNRVVPDAVSLLRKRGLDFDLIHQMGKERAPGQREALAARYAATGFFGECVCEFVADMPGALAAADLVVCRAGAMTVAELSASGRPSLLVPFAAATDGHQEANARALESAGAALVLTESEASPEAVAGFLAALFENPSRLAQMSAAARALAAPDAAARLCDLVMQVAR
jgi:UDP-N-acetylglucosamine--N-acetylmuramyl-(pentapeptide) pyrophosphoryl-undecaprenol N-acetylglucosamine transferase